MIRLSPSWMCLLSGGMGLSSVFIKSLHLLDVHQLEFVHSRIPKVKFNFHFGSGYILPSLMMKRKTFIAFSGIRVTGCMSLLVQLSEGLKVFKS